MDITPSPWDLAHSTGLRGEYYNRAVVNAAHVVSLKEDNNNIRLMSKTPEMLSALVKLHHYRQDVIMERPNLKTTPSPKDDYIQLIIFMDMLENIVQPLLDKLNKGEKK